MLDAGSQAFGATRQTLSTGDELPGPIAPPGISLVQSLLHMSTYRSPNSIDDKASTTFMILASIRNENGHFRILVEDLLDATIVYTLPRVLLACGSIIGFLGITQILRMGDIVWRIQVGVAAGRGCGIMLEGSCLGSAPW